VHSTSTQRTLRNLNFALCTFQQQSRRMQRMKPHPKMMLLLQMTLSFSFLCTLRQWHYETLAFRDTRTSRRSHFKTLALCGTFGPSFWVTLYLARWQRKTAVLFGLLFSCCRGFSGCWWKETRVITKLCLVFDPVLVLGWALVCPHGTYRLRHLSV